jgi:hypothetical protein
MVWIPAASLRYYHALDRQGGYTIQTQDQVRLGGVPFRATLIIGFQAVPLAEITYTRDGWPGPRGDGPVDVVFHFPDSHLPTKMDATQTQPFDMHGPSTEVSGGQDHDAAPDMNLLLQKLVVELQALNSNFRLSRDVGGAEQHLQETPGQQQQSAQENPANSESCPEPLHQPCQSSELAQGLAMLKGVPPHDLMFSILQDLKRAMEGCKCRIGGEPVSVLSMWEHPQETHPVHWTFRNAILVLPAGSGSSEWLRFTLHSPSSTPTPLEKETCQKFLQASWPQNIAQTTWKRYGAPLGVQEGPERSPFWNFGALRLPSTFIYLLYVPPAGQGFQFRTPRLSWPNDGKEPGSAHYLWTDLRGHPEMAQPRSPGDMNTGQIWYVRISTVADSKPSRTKRKVKATQSRVFQRNDVDIITWLGFWPMLQHC